jgi:hypothetical protein
MGKFPSLLALAQFQILGRKKKKKKKKKKEYVWANFGSQTEQIYHSSFVLTKYQRRFLRPTYFSRVLRILLLLSFHLSFSDGFRLLHLILNLFVSSCFLHFLNMNVTKLTHLTGNPHVTMSLSSLSPMKNRNEKSIKKKKKKISHA